MPARRVKGANGARYKESSLIQSDNCSSIGPAWAGPRVTLQPAQELIARSTACNTSMSSCTNRIFRRVLSPQVSILHIRVWGASVANSQTCAYNTAFVETVKLGSRARASTRLAQSDGQAVLKSAGFSLPPPFLARLPPFARPPVPASAAALSSRSLRPPRPWPLSRPSLEGQSPCSPPPLPRPFVSMKPWQAVSKL